MNVIGIIGAMEEELALLKQMAEITQVRNIVGLDVYIGKLYEKDIIMVKSGIGKVNAAICTQVIIDNFKVDCIINVGIAGAVFEGLNIGDTVISTDAVQHDMDTSVFGDPIGIIPRMKESYFKADEGLINMARAAAKTLNGGHSIIEGRVASGDKFISGVDAKRLIWDNVKGYCCEMEGAAIAHACYLNNVPFVLIRAISDNAEGDSVKDYTQFSEKAAQNAGQLLLNMIKAMP